MNRRRLISALAAMMLLSAAVLSAQTTPPTQHRNKSPFSFSITGLRAYWLGIVPTGLDLKLDYRLPPLVQGVDSIVELTAGGGFEKETYYRNPNYTPVTDPNYTTDGPNGNNRSRYNRAQAISDVGFRQGIVFNPSQDRNLLEAFVFYRFHYDHYFYPGPGGYLELSQFPDRLQILSNSVMGGFDYDTLQYDKVHKTYHGIYAETSLEWAPGFFFNSVGKADFVRWNFNGRIFRTLYTSSNPGGRNRFSIYAGDYFAADYSTGPSIPIYVQQTVGGRKLEYGLGDEVRGFEVGAWDTQLKVVNNLEIRATGPAILLPSIVPGVYAFFDSGYYNGYYRDPQNTPGGFLASTGVGVYLVSLDLASVTGLIAFPIYPERIDKAPYNISFDFSLQF